jgi:hypothetical protein
MTELRPERLLLSILLFYICAYLLYKKLMSLKLGVGQKPLTITCGFLNKTLAVQNVLLRVSILVLVNVLKPVLVVVLTVVLVVVLTAVLVVV